MYIAPTTPTTPLKAKFEKIFAFFKEKRVGSEIEYQLTMA